MNLGTPKVRADTALAPASRGIARPRAMPMPWLPRTLCRRITDRGPVAGATARAKANGEQLE
jgi:hypothetical protein